MQYAKMGKLPSLTLTYKWVLSAFDFVKIPKKIPFLLL